MNLEIKEDLIFEQFLLWVTIGDQLMVPICGELVLFDSLQFIFKPKKSRIVGMDENMVNADR